jgi:uncharacterized repeat protein (TIGR01451 family)
MSTANTNTRRFALLLALATAFTLQLLAAGSAFGAVAFELTSVSNTTVAPGGALNYHVQVYNSGDTSTEGSEVTLTATLPPGLLPASASTEAFSCAIAAQVVTCAGPYVGRYDSQTVNIVADADPGATGTLTTLFDVEGGGALVAAHSADSVRISATEPGFGLEAFDGLLSDPSGDPFTQAAGHPALSTTSIDFNTHTDPSSVIGSGRAVEDARDVTVDLPPGLVGSVAGLGQCTTPQLANGTGATGVEPLCPVSSQVGIAKVRTVEGTAARAPVFNMDPPPGVPARFAFNALGTVVPLDAHLIPTAGGYRLRIEAANIPQGLVVNGNSIAFWGVPSDPGHDPQRSCSGHLYPSEGGPTCPGSGAPRAFFRAPTSCTAQGLRYDLRADSWQHPGDFVSASYRTHALPGYPFPEEEGPAGSMHRVWGPEAGIEGCDQVPFEPTIDARLTTNRADSPTGLSVDLGLPADCWAPMTTPEEVQAAICQSDLREASVTLPQGLSLNPAAAAGRAACTPAQAGLTSPPGSAPVEFDQAPLSCPDASKIGSVEIKTPLLDDPIPGTVYLAQQGDNPFGSLLAIYLLAEGSGVRIKQAGEVALSPGGQLTTTFAAVPQTPFSNIHLELYGGQRAALRTPAACGTYTTQATLTPWSGNPAVARSSSFQITECPNSGFDPHLDAGTQNPLAGKTSPFNLRLSREDGSQELGGLQVTLPPGLSGYLKGIPYCPDATLAAVSGDLGTGVGQEHSPSCPAASQLGTVTVGAGAGLTPFYTSSGRAYLAGPYKGAPLSLAVIAPAVAGPFDLGSVVVRNALRVDPTTAQITAVSDPIPHILHGIPLDLRDIRVQLSRDHFTLNPTSCEEMQITSTIASTQGATANPAEHFQVAGCDRLGFKPKLGLKLKGGTKRGENPALTAVFRPRAGDANAARIQVALPHSEFLDQSHIRTICTRVQFAAGGGGGEACPKGSIYGKVTATSPILDYPLTGNAYLRSSSHNLPDLVLALRGPASQPIEVDAVGRIDSVNGGIRTTFAQVPDAPLTKVVLRMQGGQKSLLQNSTNLCAGAHRATVQMDAHNGRSFDSRPALRAKCGGKAHHRKHHR